MSNAELSEIWIATATTINEPQADMWSLRFVIDGVQLVEQAVKRLDAIGVTMRPNGGPMEYLVEFPPPVVLEVVTTLVDQGANLCAEQSLQPIP